MDLSSSQKRLCLEGLGASRLRQLVDALGVTASSRREKSELVAALADGRRSEFGEVLTLLRVAELKVVCEALGLDNRGRSKDDLLSRILSREGRAQGSAATAPASAG